MTSRVVLTLVQCIEESYGSVKGMHVFTDRYYTSLELAKVLLGKKVHLTGTVNKNRKGLPKEIKMADKMKKGDVKAYRKDDKFSVLQWKDKRVVLMLTTLYGDKTEEVKRIVKQGVEEVVNKPSVICR